MKKYAVYAAIMLAAMIFCPFAAMGADNSKGNHDSITAPVISYSVEDNAEYITVMSSANGSTQKIEMREYLIGCLAAEMPASYHAEALKAQAVASYTYAKRVTENSSDYISDSPLTHQGYVSRDARIKNWGSEFDENEKKLSAAVDAVYGYCVMHNGETALTVYHSISAGQTQSAAALWGSEYPYLQSVLSPGDKLSPDFTEEVNFSAEEFSQKLGIETSDGLEIKVDYSDGYAVSVDIGGHVFSGDEVRTALELKSNSFEILQSNGKVTVAVKGHGHGVGMSQYGADYMARQGSTWQEIIAHYYPNTFISETE